MACFVGEMRSIRSTTRDTPEVCLLIVRSGVKHERSRPSSRALHVRRKGVYMLADSVPPNQQHPTPKKPIKAKAKVTVSS